MTEAELTDLISTSVRPLMQQIVRAFDLPQNSKFTLLVRSEALGDGMAIVTNDDIEALTVAISSAAELMAGQRAKKRALP